MAIDDILLDAEERMDKAVEVFQNELKGVRTGTANPGLVENIKVEYYGSQTPLSHMATIAVPEPRMLVIRPYDPSSLEAIEKAIQKSDVGLNPENDGRVIRLKVPELSQERREQMVEYVKECAEEARISIRNIRRDANKELEQAEKESTISEDACHAAKEEVQELTDEHEEEVDELLDEKSDEIMTV